MPNHAQLYPNLGDVQLPPQCHRHLVIACVNGVARLGRAGCALTRHTLALFDVLLCVFLVTFIGTFWRINLVG